MAVILMTTAAKACHRPGCYRLQPCPAHYRTPFASVRTPSGTNTLYQSRAWRTARAAFLATHPWCCYCWRSSNATPATIVDHRRPHRGDFTLFWDRGNWQPLCKPCHDAKTARDIKG